jgi:hypothetical protein
MYTLISICYGKVTMKPPLLRMSFAATDMLSDVVPERGCNR